MSETGIQILVVDDEEAKRKAIRLEIDRCAGGDVQVVEATCQSDALAICKDRKVDLLILDLVIPNFRNEQPQPDGAHRLLSRMRADHRLYFPTHVICVTQHSDINAKYREGLGKQDIRLLFVDESDPEWMAALQSRLRDLLLTTTQRGLVSSRTYKEDFCVVTALQEAEMEAVREVFGVERERMVPGDHRRYYVSRISNDSASYEGILACADEPGATSMATLVTTVIHQFAPRIILLAGFAAGRQGIVGLGDVVAAECSWNLADGKTLSTGSDTPTFQREVRQIRPPAAGLALAKRWQGKLLTEIGCDIREPMQGTERFHVCPWVTSPYVVAHEREWERAEQVNRKVGALDMECYAAYYASEHSVVPRPTTIAVKGISDLGTRDKDDKWKRTASLLSARVCRQLAFAMLELP